MAVEMLATCVYVLESKNNAEGARAQRRTDCHDGGASALFVSSSELYPSGRLTAQMSDRLRGKSTTMTAAASEKAEFANSRI